MGIMCSGRRSFKRALNSHGGNVAVLSDVARELRIRFRMLAVVTGWSRFGLPPGLYDDEHAINPASHVAKKHVLGEGAMANEELVALRALRNKIYYGGTWQNANCGGR